MIVTKNLNGSYTLATIKNGYRISQTYYGYTLNECKQLFKQYVKDN